METSLFCKGNDHLPYHVETSFYRVAATGAKMGHDQRSGGRPLIGEHAPAEGRTQLPEFSGLLIKTTVSSVHQGGISVFHTTKGIRSRASSGLIISVSSHSFLLVEMKRLQT